MSTKYSLSGFHGMRRYRLIVGSFMILLFLIFLAAGCDSLSSDKASPLPNTSVMEKILKSGKIRCSYLVYGIYFIKDPNTGKFSGLFYDIMQDIGKNSGLEIEWVEEVGYESIFTGLDSDRYDVFAGGLWPNSTRAKAGFFSIPVFYSVINAYGRTDDDRFVNNLDAINSPSVRIATIDGAMEDVIAKTDFPKAKRVSLPQLSPFSQNLLNITTNKADVTFAEPGIVQEFLATNPGTLKELDPNTPLRIFGNSLVVKRGAMELQEFLNVALRELLYSGRIDKILKNYRPVSDVFRRVAIPYQKASSDK